MGVDCIRNGGGNTRTCWDSRLGGGCIRGGDTGCAGGGGALYVAVVGGRVDAVRVAEDDVGVGKIAMGMPVDCTTGRFSMSRSRPGRRGLSRCRRIVAGDRGRYGIVGEGVIILLGPV